MTKHIRIENADNSAHKVNVEIWAEYPDDIDRLVEVKELNYPTAMLAEMVYKGRYLVTREV